MRKILLTALIIMSSLVGSAQSHDERLTAAMNAGDWFELNSIYGVAPKDSVSDFIDIYSRCLIGNRLNRPELSIPAFEELLDKYSGSLEPGQIADCAMMFSIDLSRVGDNARAASVLQSMMEANEKKLSPAVVRGMENFIKKYQSLEGYDPYVISFDSDTGLVPFKVVPVGKPEDNGVHMHLDDSYINGIAADIIFDTGAGVNVISDSLAVEYNLTPLDVETKVSGVGSHIGKFAIAKELKIGNISVADVPFYVMDITANNVEADQYLNDCNIIVGGELMLQLKDLTIDFDRKRITVPVVPPGKTDAAPNMCFSNGMIFLCKAAIQGVDLLVNVDTGDALYGSLGEKFYKGNKKYVKSHGTSTTIRTAGIGGINISKCYRVPDMSLSIGGNTEPVPELVVLTKDNSFGHECNLGLRSLMLFQKVRFNLVDFVLSTTGSRSHTE